MKNKINLVEFLKDCPEGMELDCTMYDDTVFYGITDDQIFPIRIKRVDGGIITLTKYGEYSNCPSCKCVIFPKGKTTWEGFVPPCQFKDGDVISDSFGSCIFKGEGRIKGTVDYYCGILAQHFHVKDSKQNHNAHYGDIVNYRLATEEEKAKLFQTIKDNGYKWNPETKTLEKLIEPKFHEGDWVVTDYEEVNQVITVNEDGEGFTLDDGSYFSGSWKDMYHLWTIKDAKEGDVLASDNGNIILVKESRDSSWGYRLSYHCAVLYNGTFESREFHVFPENFLPATKEQRELLFQKMKEAGYEWNAETKTLKKLVNKNKFAIGDTITNGKLVGKIRLRDVDSYQLEDGTYIFFNEVPNWKLVPNKFDINTLVPFESKVLIRDHKSQKWNPAIWGTYDNDPYYPYRLIGTISHCCIPYEGNEHLLGTTNDCDDFYKTWD